MEVKVLDSQGKKVPVEIKPSAEDKTYDVVYYPSAVGKYTVYITFSSENIPKSPFQVGVVQTNSAACRAYGPGLEKVWKSPILGVYVFFTLLSRKL